MRATFIRVALLSGLRFGEILGLKWEQINFERRTLRVGRAKTEAGTRRMIPLNAALAAVLGAQADRVAALARRPVDPAWHVFPLCDRRHPVDPTRPSTAIKTAWTSVRKAAGVQCRFHDPRHTAGTKMAEAGVPEATMKAIMGHMSAAMIERYSHVREDAKRAAVEALTLADESVGGASAKVSARVASKTTIQ